MGCVQTRPSPNSPPATGGGLGKMKRDNGYVAAAARRSSRRSPPRAARPAVNGSEGRRSGRRSIRENRKEEEEKKGEVAVVAPPPPRMAEVRPAAAVDEVVVEGWPKWLTDNIPSEVLAGLVPRSADSYDKLDKVGQGTYSNVYRARDRDTGKIVALKKVRFDTSETESIRFMAREIMILQKLDHPNIIKLEGLATSRMQYSLYLVFEFMQSDLARVVSRPEGRLTEPQAKCYMHQLLSGLKHCHERGILHRDIKGSNLLIDKTGMLKIADFGLANYFNPNKKRPLTSRVVTLWYRAPELLLGTTDYGVGIDLWSAGCLLAEMFTGRPIMPGRTEVEQLHRIFKLCGSPPEDYWRKLRLSTNFRPPQPYKSSIVETFRDFPSSSLGLLKTLLALDPSHRGSAASALQNDFFITSPLACGLSGLPVIYKEEDDELIKPRERRKRRSSRLKGSRTQKEDSRNVEQDIVKLKVEDSGLPKELMHMQHQRNSVSTPPLLSPMKSPSLYEKIRVQSTYSHELGSSTTGSTSSHAQREGYSMSPPPYPPAMKSSVREQRTEAHPSAAKNIQNLTSRQASRPKVLRINNQLYGMEKRSSSASGFRRFEGKHIPK